MTRQDWALAGLASAAILVGILTMLLIALPRGT